MITFLLQRGLVKIPAENKRSRHSFGLQDCQAEEVLTYKTVRQKKSRPTRPSGLDGPSLQDHEAAVRKKDGVD